MFLYWIESERRYVHRKDDVPKGLPIDRVDVPTTTEGLMGYLNGLISRQPDQIVVNVPEGEVHEVLDIQIDGMPLESLPPVENIPMPPVLPPMTAEAVLSRIDSPGVDVEGVVEAIAKARGHSLKRYAGAIAMRFHELEKI